MEQTDDFPITSTKICYTNQQIRDLQIFEYAYLFIYQCGAITITTNTRQEILNNC